MLDQAPKHLREAAGIAPWLAQRLADFAIVDSAQLVGAVSVEGVEDRLAEGLGVDREVLADAVAAVRDEADWTGACEESFATGFGASAPTPEVKAEIGAMTAALAAPPVVPPAVNRSGELPVVGDGGSCEASVASAVSTVYAHHRRREGFDEALAEALASAKTARAPCQLKALQALDQAGACKPLVLAADDVRGAKNALAAGRLMAVTVPVYASWARNPGVRRTGRITMRLGDEPAIGGLALCIVGYQDKADYPGGGYFVVRGCDAEWGYASAYGPGHGTIPYAYIAQEGWELAGVA